MDYEKEKETEINPIKNRFKGSSNELNSDFNRYRKGIIDKSKDGKEKQNLKGYKKTEIEKRDKEKSDSINKSNKSKKKIKHHSIKDKEKPKDKSDIKEHINDSNDINNRKILFTKRYLYSIKKFFKYNKFRHKFIRLFILIINITTKSK